MLLYDNVLIIFCFLLVCYIPAGHGGAQTLKKGEDEKVSLHLLVVNTLRASAVFMYVHCNKMNHIAKYADFHFKASFYENLFENTEVWLLSRYLMI